jgi:hypothetical protein
VNLLTSACDFLTITDPVAQCDTIVVLAGRFERKLYGIELFQLGLAQRLILSIGRFEVTQTAAPPIAASEIISVRDKLPPERRHFWLDYENGERKICEANLKRPGTIGELRALAIYLAQRSPASIAIVSTSIHLRRIRFCCSRISHFTGVNILFWPVPEEMSSFRKEKWWRRPDHWRYLISEYIKLAGYCLVRR